MSREVCGICWCPYDEETGECACAPQGDKESAMNRDDIIRMAREMGCEIPSGPEGVEFFFYPQELERFATLVAAAERERVMQIVQSMKADLEAKFENVYMEGAMAGAAAEREACAKVCDLMEQQAEGTDCCKWPTPTDCAAAIRSRSNP